MTNPLSVTLISKPGYLVRAGDKDLGVFREEGDWEGMKRLVDNKGQVLIVDVGTGFVAAFKQMFPTASEGFSVTVVKASPSIINELLPKPIPEPTCAAEKPVEPAVPSVGAPPVAEGGAL